MHQQRRPLPRRLHPRFRQSSPWSEGAKIAAASASAAMTTAVRPMAAVRLAAPEALAPARSDRRCRCRRWAGDRIDPFRT
jgi:hypothetical protein